MDVRSELIIKFTARPNFFLEGYESAVLYNTAMRGFAMKIYKYDEKLFKNQNENSEILPCDILERPLNHDILKMPHCHFITILQTALF